MALVELPWGLTTAELAAGSAPGALPLSTYEMLVTNSSLENMRKFAQSVAYRFSSVGVRMERGKGFFRALVNEQWADFGGSYGSASWTQWRFDIGFKF